MKQTSRNLIALVDPKWPAMSDIERVVLKLGFETALVRDTSSLGPYSKRLAAIIIDCPADQNLSRVLRTVKQFTAEARVVFRVEARDAAWIQRQNVDAGHVVIGQIDEQQWQDVLQVTPEAPVTEASEEAVMDVAPAQQPMDTSQFIFMDPKSQHLLALAERLARTNAAVLLNGPTGTGKEVLARVIHALSPRSQQPFVAMNCAAMPEHLVEDMLFGHEKGAFTGAARELPGIFEQGQGGTVFLDEIGEMPIQLQAKLLRVIQEKEVTRLGGRSPIRLDFRLVAATNRDLKKGIEERQFREDLYYRISAFKLQIPTLADRPGDILPLAKSLAAKHGNPQAQFTDAALRQLFAYHWPGNVRELDNVIQRALVFSESGRIDAEHILLDEPITRTEPRYTPSYAYPEQFEPRRELPQFSEVQPQSATDLHAAVRASEQEVILEAIRSTKTRDEAAKKLGISPRTLRYKIAKLREFGSATHLSQSSFA
ncbi:MAG: AAA family ATPase [Gammaproteobacteria bacterium]|nr:AAA family ATPase [Gammaproteobacteria bacterium]